MENGRFDYDGQAPDEAMPRPSDVLVPIISEWDGGVIGYALGVDHARAMVAALNTSWADIEYVNTMKESERMR
ncbi:MAG: hypothetical protein IT345_10730 [Trueperaceae bacterium]|nr:hypothetical protein [Trueperaceae bacterium]